MSYWYTAFTTDTSVLQHCEDPELFCGPQQITIYLWWTTPEVGQHEDVMILTCLSELKAFFISLVSPSVFALDILPQLKRHRHVWRVCCRGCDRVITQGRNANVDANCCNLPPQVLQCEPLTVRVRGWNYDNLILLFLRYRGDTCFFAATCQLQTHRSLH